MTDCPNAEMRDRLPDLLHERLDMSVRSLVFAHVADCVDCRDELELLRGVQQVLVMETPRVDVSYVLAALPKPSTTVPSHIPLRATRRFRSLDWRVAAAVTLLAAGSGSLALLNRTPAASSATPVVGIAVTTPVTTAAVPSVNDSAPAVAGSSVTAAPATASETVARAEAPGAGADAGAEARLGDLNEQQLKSLLDDIQGLKPVPLAEPDPVAIRVTGQTSGLEDS